MSEGGREINVVVCPASADREVSGVGWREPDGVGTGLDWLQALARVEVGQPDAGRVPGAYLRHARWSG